MDWTNAVQLGRLGTNARTQRVRAHRDREMRPLPVHIAMITTAQLRGGHVDQRVGPPLRRRPHLSTTHPVTERVDRSLQQRAAFGIELTTEDEHAAIGLIAREPAAFVGTVVIGEHPVGVEAQPGGLRESPHLTGFEGLRSSHQDALERLDLLDADIFREVGDHGHVGEGGATGTSAVQRRRQLAQGLGQVHAVHRRPGRHAAMGAHPGHRGAAAIGLRSALGVEAMQATDELCFKTIHGAPDVDQVLAEGLRRERIDGLVDE